MEASCVPFGGQKNNNPSLSQLSSCLDFPPVLFRRKLVSHLRWNTGEAKLGDDGSSLCGQVRMSSLASQESKEALIGFRGIVWGCSGVAAPGTKFVGAQRPPGPYSCAQSSGGGHVGPCKHHHLESCAARAPPWAQNTARSSGGRHGGPLQKLPPWLGSLCPFALKLCLESRCAGGCSG